MEELLEKWEEIKLSVQKEHSISDICFKTWIKPLEIYDLNDNEITIIINSEHKETIGYISSKYLLPIKVGIAEAMNKEYEIKFVLESEINSNSNNFAYDSGNTAKENVIHEKANLNPKYTFDTFVVGKNNDIAHSASLAVADCPGKIYNPLFLYGGVGLGKTHLMHSIGHYILDNNPSSRVIYTTGEQFTNELIEYIRIGNNTPNAMVQFREKYRNVDVLLIDDIQFIIGKERTQEEFFNTFNKLQMDNKQIVISSDKPPKDMEVLEDRLKSRFSMGLIIDIQTPDYETRVAILQKKLETDGHTINSEVINYIAKNVNSNIRELEGSLNKVIAYSNLEKREITIELAEKVLKDIISPNSPVEITPQYIIDVVCEHFNIKQSDIMTKSRKEEIVIPRQIIMYLCTEYTNVSSTKIGELLGKDHSTILHGYKAIKNTLENDEIIKNKVNTIIKKLNI